MTFSSSPIFLSIDRGKIGAWRASRIYMACRWFALTVDPNCDIQAKYDVDHQRIGWTFSMRTADGRKELHEYYSMIMQAPA